MAEVLRTFELPVSDATGEYQARAVGRAASDNMWEGWCEFVPVTSGAPDVLVSSVETTQPNREQLLYWASGLTQVYAEGALARAQHPVTIRTRVVDRPFSDAPAPRIVTSPTRDLPRTPEPVLDPFHIGARSLDVLAQELTALDRPRLLNIIDAYDLNPAGTDITSLSDAQLMTFIVTAVDVQLKVRG